MIWQCASHKLDTKMPIVMGILNITPDSFSDGGSYETLDDAIAAARTMVEQGAQIIDVGGESTRPDATPVAPDEELARVLPVVTALVAEGMCVSIDTRHASVARACVDAGAAIVNDVTGFEDPAMVEVAKTSDAGLIVVHCGNHFQNEGIVQTLSLEATSQNSGDVVDRAIAFLTERAHFLESEGIDAARICIDPGPGFGKNESETIAVVRNLHEFVHIGYPVMASLSRKRYIGRAYHIDDPKERDTASAAEALLACELGACVVRVHNVELTCEALRDLRPYVLLGMGANVALVAEPGEETEAKIAQLNHAIGNLCTLPDTQLIDTSSFYESEPAYYLDQDTFVNCVVLLRTGISPKELLEYLHAIENSLGRVREIENGPRTCDIDILDYQTYIVDTDILTLPHPRVTERDFVVKPLLEICPRHILADGTPVDCIPEAKRFGRAWRI